MILYDQKEANMKALFVLFIIISSFSSQGKFLDVYQNKTKETQEQKEYEQHLFNFYYLAGSDEYIDMAINFVNFLEEEELKGNKICISFNPDEDWNGAQNDVAFFTLFCF